jgi:hypothetical protein
MRKVFATLALAGALAFGAPAVSEAQVVTGGLVNVTLVDVVDVNVEDVQVLNNVAIGIAANVAAQICGTQVAVPANIVGVIASSVARQGQATACTITGQDGRQKNVQVNRNR